MENEVKVAEHLTTLIERSDKTQKEIAAEVGFPKANVLTMMKQGITKVPISRVPALARALEVEPAELMKIVLKEYQPEILEAIEESLGKF